MIRALAIALPLALAGCIVMAVPVTQVEPLAITYRTGACYGTCPVYAVTVRADGSGEFAGDRFTAVTGHRAFTLTSAQFDAFATQLQPYRPASGNKGFPPEECGSVATDMPIVDITWAQGSERQQLNYYFGCGMDKFRAMATALRTAPELLPIADLIGKR